MNMGVQTVNTKQSFGISKKCFPFACVSGKYYKMTSKHHKWQTKKCMGKSACYLFDFVGHSQLFAINKVIKDANEIQHK